MSASEGSILAQRAAGLETASGHPLARRLGQALKRHPRIAVFGGFLLLIWIVGVCAPLLAPYNPYAVNTHNLTQAPSWSHLAGTDELGRDTFTRVLYGGRLSLIVAVIVVLISSSIGISLGLITGYYGGTLDLLVGRWVDAQLAFPGLLLILAIISTFGQSLTNVVLVIGLLGWTGYYRLTRGQVLQAREFEFVRAARSLGVKDWRIMWRHILPNIANPIVVVTSLAAGGAILTLSTVSFLGLGATPPEAEWGSMFFKALGDFRLHPWLIFGPGAAVFITVFAYYILGDALRDALDPRLRGR
ncbi:MAG: ABC transporter permease [Dehalococcoidia bacterium]